MRPGYVYRVCKECGEVVNVAKGVRYGKTYLCPRCAGQPWFMTWPPRKEARRHQDRKQDRQDLSAERQPGGSEGLPDMHEDHLHDRKL